MFTPRLSAVHIVPHDEGVRYSHVVCAVYIYTVYIYVYAYTYIYTHIHIAYPTYMSYSIPHITRLSSVSVVAYDKGVRYSHVICADAEVLVCIGQQREE